MSRWYRLDGDTPVLILPGRETMRDRWQIRTKVGKNTEVSTVFLALDHAYGGGPPVLFETLVLGGSLDQSMDRY